MTPIPAALLELLRAEDAALQAQGVELLRMHLGDAPAVAALRQEGLLAPGISLAHADLRGADLQDTSLGRADLSHADLRGADLSRARLRDGILRGARLARARLRHAELAHADLREADLEGADLRGADLLGVDLAGARLAGALYDGLTRLPAEGWRGGGQRYLGPGADLRGADLRGVDLAGADLRGAAASGAGLSGALLRNALLRGAVLDGADLSGASLLRADLAYADLTGADLRDADLRGADLRCADLAGARMQGARTQKARRRLPRPSPPPPSPAQEVAAPPPEVLRVEGLRAPYLDLEGMELRRVVLRGADLRGADLRGAVLEAVDLRGADLRGASLAGARLERVRLEGARLEGADLRWVAGGGAEDLPAGEAMPEVAGALPGAFPRPEAEAALRLRAPGALRALAEAMAPEEAAYRGLLLAVAGWMEASGPPRTPERDPAWLSRRVHRLDRQAQHHLLRRGWLEGEREGSAGWLDAGARVALDRAWEEVLPPVGTWRWVAAGRTARGRLEAGGHEDLLPLWSPAHPIVLLEGPVDAPRFPTSTRFLADASAMWTEFAARCWVWGGLWSHLDLRSRLRIHEQAALLASPQAAALETLRLEGLGALYPLASARRCTLPNLRGLQVRLAGPGIFEVPDLSAALPNLERLEILRVPGEPGAEGQASRVEIGRLRLPRLQHLAIHAAAGQGREPPLLHRLRLGEVSFPSLLTTELRAERMEGLHRALPRD